MTVFLNANSVSELKFHPPGGSRATAIAVPVKKENIEDFFPEAMSFLSCDYMSVDCFKKKLIDLIIEVLTDIRDRVNSELVQFDREEAEKNYYQTQFDSIATTQSSSSRLHPKLRSKGIPFKGVPSHPKSQEEQRRLLGSAIYYDNLKPLMQMRMGQECWFSLTAWKMFEEREKELKQLYADAEIYETKVKYSAASAALSVASVAAKSFAVSNAVKKTAASVFFNKVPESIATRNLVASTLSISSKINKVSNSLGLGLMLSEKKELDEIHAKSGTTTVPIDSTHFLGVIGKGLQLIDGHFGFSAGIVDMGYNNLAAMHTYDAIASFHETVGSHVSKISQAVYRDFEKLQDDEIEALMRKLGINKNEYISL